MEDVDVVVVGQGVALVQQATGPLCETGGLEALEATSERLMRCPRTYLEIECSDSSRCYPGMA